MIDFIKSEKGRKKLNRKNKGPETRKPAHPKRMAKAKRLFNSKKDELMSQGAKLLMRFLEDHPEVDPTLAIAEGLWAFIRWLKEKEYSIVHANDLLVAPFSKFAKLKDLK